MKRLLLCLLVLFTGLSVASCGKDPIEPDPQPQVEPQPEPQPQPQPVVEKFTVKFVNTSLADKTVEKGTSVSRPSDPVKDGYIFGGWFSDSEMTNEASFPIVVNADTKVYAKFNSYKNAFAEARNKTIGENVEGYEFDYSIEAVASYNATQLTGLTNGNAKYSKNGEISYYDSSTSSGALFFDGSKYQIKKDNVLQQLKIDKNGKLKSFTSENVPSTFKYDSSSFAKAIFEYSDDQLKEITKTTGSNVYELKTTMNVSQLISKVSSVLNSPIIEKIIKGLPSNDVSTHMYVTFSNGELKSYRYVMSINVAALGFDLAYQINFKNIGQSQTIVPQSFEGISISSSEINEKMDIISSLFQEYKAQENSGYNFTVKTGLNYPSKNSIDSTFKGFTKRKISDGKVYFFNEIEIDSDYKNADLYKYAELVDIKYRKSKLVTDEIYCQVHDKKVLGIVTGYSDPYILNDYVATTEDNFYMLSLIDCITSVNYVQKETKNSKDTYAIGISRENAINMLKWANLKLDLDPLNKASKDILIFGNFSENTIELESTETTIIVESNKILSVEVKISGLMSTSLPDSRDFTAASDGEFSLSYKIEFTSDGDSFEPYATLNDAK